MILAPMKQDSFLDAETIVSAIVEALILKNYRFTKYRTPNDDVKIYGLLWDQDWRTRLFNRLNSDVEYFQSDDGSDELNLKLIAQKTIFPEIKLTGTFQHIISNYDTSRDSRATNLSLGLSWQLPRMGHRHRDLWTGPEPALVAD